jgi:CelD/BcsL family acetyltransferase involved in cellulose biosynthesis
LQKISANVEGIANPLTYLECAPYPSSGYSIALGTRRETLYARPSISRMRAKLRRLRKKLGECGPVDFTTAPDENVARCLFALKRQKYLRTTGTDFFDVPGVADFYREMAAPGRIGRISHLCALSCGSEIVSAHLGFVGRGKFHWVLPAFDMQYRRFAVGHMLLHHLIDRCFDDGYAAFDLGEGDHYYKAAWATHRLALCSFERALTPTGHVFLQMRRVRRMIGAARLRDLYAKGRARLSATLGLAYSPAMSNEPAGIGEAAI